MNCEPRVVEKWEEYYFIIVNSKEHITELGKKALCKNNRSCSIRT